MDLDDSQSRIVQKERNENRILQLFVLKIVVKDSDLFKSLLLQIDYSQTKITK